MEGESKRRKLDLLDVLNNMYLDQDEAKDGKRKTRKQQLLDNAASILQSANTLERVIALGYAPCKVTTLSLDGRGRAQRSMRIDAGKVNFRPWHITWIASKGVAPLGLQYSHRCHEENCCEPTHGLWESDAQNKGRWSCRECSHLVLPDGRCVVVCPHEPCCLRPLVLKDWSDKRFVTLPLS